MRLAIGRRGRRLLPVLILLGLVVFSSFSIALTRAQASVELKYDDGTGEASISYTQAKGHILAVKFSLDSGSSGATFDCQILHEGSALLPYSLCP